ncbi:MAG: hypothetical protein K6G10_00585 [Butyrivibrio sp.]|nr:hypothetical protein [Butyrivibrio sp.]
MMDFGFLASANSITSKYLDQNIKGSGISEAALDEDIKKKFGAAFEEAYDSMVATKMLNANMRQNYEAAHDNAFKEHASRLGYSIDNRVIDMLHLQLSDDMNNRVGEAMNNAIDSIA